MQNYCYFLSSALTRCACRIVPNPATVVTLILLTLSSQLTYVLRSAKPPSPPPLDVRPCTHDDPYSPACPGRAGLVWSVTAGVRYSNVEAARMLVLGSFT